MKTCTKCQQEKPIDEFRFQNKKEGKRQAQCRDCMSIMQAAHYRANKATYIKRSVEFTRKQRKEKRQKLVEYLFDHPCVDCGESNPVVLQFDHLRDKKYNIGDMVRSGYGWDSILKEIEKCEVCCANCHMKRTAKTGNWYKQSLVE